MSCGEITVTDVERDEGGLACVVLSLRSPPELVDAVRSLADQPGVAEIVVVNSGGGDPIRSLAAAGLAVRVVNRTERLFPGAARNVGIDATSARYVAFLASDCRAEPEWASARLRHHRSGADAVSSVMTNASGDSLSSRAAHLLLHPRRLPQTPPHERVLFGLSYDRSVFDRFGRFREDLRRGEDSEFNARIRGDATIVWADDVRTAHRNTATARALLVDQFTRGATTIVYDRLSIPALLRVGVLKEPLFACWQAWRTPDPAERRGMIAAAPLVLGGAAARTAGVLWKRLRDRRS
jgi:glycosyltransferase involved in cell wall biosynthesis